tara:strand:- start:221 stop:529 length:309 start_codon:yes stop_codon:yes gene_type:complete
MELPVKIRDLRNRTTYAIDVTTLKQLLREGTETLTHNKLITEDYNPADDLLNVLDRIKVYDSSDVRIKYGESTLNVGKNLRNSLLFVVAKHNLVLPNYRFSV